MSTTPVEDRIRLKLDKAFNPTTLNIANDSASHAHHTAMAGSVSKETHFRVLITSDDFLMKTQPARHRMVYTVLNDELKKEGGIHALQLKTQTIGEEQILWRKARAEGAV
ncbi:uncharacterized protein KY384_001752 [Bacidia gigantensis]|uniref:uncharacterized protein n=1 Tax=Bacidia gigantensis TaxID=2732470 RepID=UPI001D04775E|nr:uncharacterized protein KY384_001752 [Bacidia gigantensis]KAG8532970.1 hypothetical protein KY384_001752 [Bacidia gigantensis]